MKTIFEWFTHNITTLFTFLGIFLTMYFSIFYIPGYVLEMRNEKINNVNDSLIENIQELVYNNHKLEINDLKSMIKGKELKNKITYPYSIEELIILTQERFVENKFIPLQERTELIAALNSIILQTSKLNTTIISKPKDVSMFTSLNILAVLASIIGVILGIIGFLSTSFKLKREKEINLELDINKREDEIQNYVKNDLEYERMIEELLSTLKVEFEKTSIKQEYGYDFFVKGKNNNFAIEAKYYARQRKISSNTILHIIGIISRLKSKGILVTNVDLTQSAQNIIKEYNLKNQEYTVNIIKGEEKEELKEQFSNLLFSYHNPSSQNLHPS